MRPAILICSTMTTLLLVAGSCTVENPDYQAQGPGAGSTVRRDGAGPGAPTACSSSAQCKGAA